MNHHDNAVQEQEKQEQAAFDRECLKRVLPGMALVLGSSAAVCLMLLA